MQGWITNSAKMHRFLSNFIQIHSNLAQICKTKFELNLNEFEWNLKEPCVRVTNSGTLSIQVMTIDVAKTFGCHLIHQSMWLMFMWQLSSGRSGRALPPENIKWLTITVCFNVGLFQPFFSCQAVICLLSPSGAEQPLCSRLFSAGLKVWRPHSTRCQPQFAKFRPDWDWCL